MNAQDQPQSLTLDGHIIDCSRPIKSDCKNVFITEDDKKLQIAAKRISTDNPTQLQRSFERSQDLNS